MESEAEQSSLVFAEPLEQQEDRTQESIVINYLSEGSYFGEIALITKLKRTASVKATDNCTLSTMSREILTMAQEEYP